VTGEGLRGKPVLDKATSKAGRVEGVQRREWRQGRLRFACHYCERTDGFRSNDHKIPKMIVRGCLMCNSIKGARLHERFAPFFQLFIEFLAKYLRANPDDWVMVGAMTQKFNE
jgi:hypothetical protein